MRILHVTDTHLGADRWFRGAPAGWRRGDDHLAALETALAPAYGGEVDLVVHTGDLFDRSRPSARAVKEAVRVLSDLGRVVPSVIMPGNHDRRGLRVHLGTIPGVEIVDEAANVRIAGLRLAMVPYLATAGAWAAAAAAACRGGVDLVLAHQAFDGVRVPGFTFRVGAAPDTVGAAHLPPDVRFVLCGHIHPRQVVPVGDAVVVHPGSTERTAFSERTEAKGTALWDLGGAVPTWRFVDGSARPMHVVSHPDTLADVGPGHLVLLKGAAETVEVERAALARGAWVSPWAAPTAQMALFP
ncbi:MAG: metallophosphoesterase family protein [Pseudomonadota bacterium]|nr:metallophosphoesterase family protein [Pseudomonadota bacterium]